MKKYGLASRHKTRLVDKGKYHKAKLLLKIYRDAVWRLEQELSYTRDAVEYLGGKHVSCLADFISLDIDGYYSARDKKAFEERLTSIAESKIMIDTVDKALLRVKSYHDRGEIYYRILYDNYISRKKLDQAAIQLRIGLSHSTYYRYKKEAINLFSTQLWGLIQMPLVDIWGNITVAEAAEERFDSKMTQG
ncbi:MAG TPA: hypothetical protein VFD33_07990 [Bacillota bacterium]|nr:hypothetical protein [Bacillota bacterium]